MVVPAPVIFAWAQPAGSDSGAGDRPEPMVESFKQVVAAALSFGGGGAAIDADGGGEEMTSRLASRGAPPHAADLADRRSRRCAALFFIFFVLVGRRLPWVYLEFVVFLWFVVVTTTDRSARCSWFLLRRCRNFPIQKFLQAQSIVAPNVCTSTATLMNPVHQLAFQEAGTGSRPASEKLWRSGQIPVSRTPTITSSP